MQETNRAPPDEAPDFSIVIPAYNEERHIGPVVRGVRGALPRSDVLVVDDGSHDRTRFEARAAGARVVSHVFNLGYGAALQTGYKRADRDGYQYVIQLDADGQHPPDALPRLLAPLEAGTAEDGIRLANEHKPDLVLMDIQLPGMNGIEALGVLRADPATAKIPVIAVTASVMQQDRKLITEAGFDAYIGKPINLKEFLATVSKWLGGKT